MIRYIVNSGIAKKYLEKIKKENGEVNMIAIVLILVVVIMLAVIFKDSMEGLLKNIFERINEDVENF